MDRIAGIETEYGCLVNGDAVHPNGDAWPVRVKNQLFRRMRAGAIDLVRKARRAAKKAA